MARLHSAADADAIEGSQPYAARGLPASIYRFLGEASRKYGASPAISFQLFAHPGAPAETLSWGTLYRRVTQAANLFRSLGVGQGDPVAFILPNSNETVITLLAGAVVGIVNPVNPLLEPGKIASILRATGAKVVVTLRSFPRSDLAQTVALALAEAPDVRTVVEIDLNHYLTAPKRWIVPFVRPKMPPRPGLRVLDFAAECARQPGDRLTFTDAAEDRIGAYFHTGGTTGMPKIARHRVSGMVYNGWLGGDLIFGERDVFICPLPLFHVFAAYPVLMSCIRAGAHMVMPTPQGYRGEGVFDNFWKLIARWKVTFLITVPTAISVLMQRPVDADVSSLKTAISGSAPLPLELYERFKAATGVEIAEGYGLTEATCLVSCNPIDGPKKVGSVGIALPYSHVRILRLAADGTVVHECGTDEVGEICVASPGVWAGETYLEPQLNRGLFADGVFLRTGDLGRLDADRYLWITGRSKDLIIRGGHNIDPAAIEEVLMAHPAVAMASAIGQPDPRAGEIPAVYVELVAGARVTEAELLAFAQARIAERAAVPKYLEILPELPKTVVGKVFKPDLRRMAIRRVFDAALAEAGLAARVREVADDPRRGMVVRVERTGPVDDDRIAHLMASYTLAWEWAA